MEWTNDDTRLAAESLFAKGQPVWEQLAMSAMLDSVGTQRPDEILASILPLRPIYEIVPWDRHAVDWLQIARELLSHVPTPTAEDRAKAAALKVLAAELLPERPRVGDSPYGCPKCGEQLPCDCEPEDTDDADRIKKILGLDDEPYAD
jgi:hypothetical protein